MSWTDKLVETVKRLEVENKDLKEAKIERISMLNKVAKRAGEDNELIIKLQSQLDKHRWIPVTERLPKKGDEVFVLGGKIGRTGCWNGKSWIGFGITVRFKKAITHWKPIILPESEEGEFEVEGCNGCINLETCPSKGEKCNDFVLEGRAQDEEGRAEK